MEGGGKLSNWTTALPESERQARVQSLIGTTVNGTAEDATGKYTIRAIAYLTEKEEILLAESSTENLLDNLIRLTGEENSSFWQIRENNERAGFIIICGWGDDDSPTKTTDTRYIFAFSPTE